MTRKMILLTIILAILLVPTIISNYKPPYSQQHRDSLKPKYYVSVSGFSVQFSFDIPVSILNIPNDTEYIQTIGSIIIKNIGTEDAQIKLRYFVDPPMTNISVAFSNNNFVLGADKETKITVQLTIRAHTIAGKYRISISATATPTEVTGPNPISYTQSYTLYAYIGGKSYTLWVNLVQPDGTPAYAQLTVAQIIDNTPNVIYRVYGSNFTFFLVEGQYLLTATRNKMKIERTLNLTSNRTETIMFSLVRLENIQILRVPQSTEDSLLFKFALINDDPLVYHRVITIRANLYFMGSSTPIVSNVLVSSVTIRSTMTEILIGSIYPPEQGWENNTYYALEIVAYSKDAIMASERINVHIIVIQKTLIIYQEYTPLFPLLLFSVIGGLIGFIAARKTTKLAKPVSRAPFKIRFVGITAKGTLISMYDFTKKRAMLMNTIEKNYPSFITLIKNILSVQPTSWALEEPLPIAWNDGKNKVLVFPIDQDFHLVVGTNPRVNERDFKVLRKIRQLANFIRRLHAENKLTYDYVMKRQREYIAHLRRIVSYIRSNKLA